MIQSNIASVNTFFKTAFILFALTILAGIAHAEGTAVRPSLPEPASYQKIFYTHIVELE